MLIEQISLEIDAQKKSLDSARMLSIESPGRMQSRYDSTAIESAWVADGLSRALAEKRRNIELLFNLRMVKICDRIVISSVVTLEIEDKVTPSIKSYFIVPVASGYKLETDERVVFTLTPEAPLGRALLEKKVGDEVIVGGALAKRGVIVTII